MIYEDLERLKGLYKNATGGKWSIKKFDKNINGYIVKTKSGLCFAAIDNETNRVLLLSKENAEFIAGSKEVMPKMFKFIEQLQERVILLQDTLRIADGLLEEAQNRLSDENFYTERPMIEGVLKADLIKK